MDEKAYSETVTKMEKTLSSLKTDMNKIRTGRASLALFDDIRVDYYGTPTPEHRISIIEGFRKAVGSDNVVTTNQQIPLTGNIAIAELVKADYLFTDASKSKHGLTVSYAANAEGLVQPVRTEVSESGAIMMPDAESGITFDQTMAAKMTGVLVPPITGEYQLGAKGCEGFRLSIDGKVIVDEMQGGALRTAGNLIHLEKDKAYNVLVEFTHSTSTGGSGAAGRGMGGRGFGGTTRGMVAGGGGRVCTHRTP